MNHQIKREKTLEASKSFRENGNSQFSLKDYAGCVETYTQSILSCPDENEVELSLAYANRSAALYELSLYEDCIKDIVIAVSKNYPSHLLPKILLRKVKCFRSLNLMEDSQSALKELEEAMKNMQVSDRCNFFLLFHFRKLNLINH